jgi:hypothetical protein
LREANRGFRDKRSFTPQPLKVLSWSQGDWKVQMPNMGKLPFFGVRSVRHETEAERSI